MISFVTIRGRRFDIIEQFDDYLVVQDLTSKKIYSIKVSFLDFSEEVKDTVEEPSNVFSIEWFKLNKAVKKQRDKENGKKS